MIDVLESLANGFVAEPLADGLRRVPAVNESGASSTEAPVPWRLMVHRSVEECDLQWGSGVSLTHHEDMCTVYDTQPGTQTHEPIRSQDPPDSGTPSRE